MKRRKIIGLILFSGTLVYLLASLLALYQNQRVVLEKGMEEALKAYAKQDELNVKELNKDFNLMLNEKVDRSVLDSQVVKYEGSFARMEKNITNVTEEMATVEYNINQLNERINNVAEFYQSLCDEIINQNLFSQTLYEEIESQNQRYETLQEEMISQNQLYETLKEEMTSQNQLYEILKEEMASQNQLYETLKEEFDKHSLLSEEERNETRKLILSIQEELEIIGADINSLEEMILKNDSKQEEDVRMLREQIALCQQRLTDLEGNVLFFQYDEETRTLNMFGKEEGGQPNE